MKSPPEVPHHHRLAGSLSGDGDSLFYSIKATSDADPLAVTLVIPTSNAANFDMFLYDSSGSLISSSLGTSRQEVITHKHAMTGSYRLEVRSFSGSGSYYADISGGHVASPAEGALATGASVSLSPVEQDEPVEQDAPVALSGPASLSGRVINADTGAPIQGADVTDGTWAVSSDDAGAYFAGSVLPDTYQVAVFAYGYCTVSSTVTVTGGSQNWDFRLREGCDYGPSGGDVILAGNGWSLEE